MDTSFKEEFYNKLKHAVIDGLEIVRSISVKYRLNNSTVERHGDWPSFTYIGDTALPGFRITNLGPRDYSYDFVLDFMASEIPSPKSWEEYHDFVYATDKLTSFFRLGKT